MEENVLQSTNPNPFNKSIRLSPSAIRKHANVHMQIQDYEPFSLHFNFKLEACMHEWLILRIYLPADVIKSESSVANLPLKSTRNLHKILGWILRVFKVWSDLKRCFGFIEALAVGCWSR